VFEEPFRLVNRLKWLEKETWKDRTLMFVMAAVVFIFMAGFVLPMGSQGKQAKSVAARQAEPHTVTESQTRLADNTEKDTSWWDKLKKNRIDADYNIGLKETEEFYAIILPMRGPITQVNDAMYRLQGYLKGNDIEPDGPSFIRQISSTDIPNPEYEQEWEAGYPVRKKIQVSRPFLLKKYPAEKCIFSRVKQSLEEDGWNQAMAEFLFSNNLMVSNPSFVYCPDQLYDYNDWNPKWEVQIPVKQSGKPFPKVPIYTKWTEAMVALVLPMQGSYKQETAALQKLNNYLREINVQPQSEPFFRYFNNEEFVPEEEVLWEAGYAVPKGSRAEAPFEIRYFPEELVISSEFEYDTSEILLYAHSMALSYVIEGYRAVGYPMRILKNGLEKDIQVNEFRIPVRRARYNITQLPRF